MPTNKDLKRLVRERMTDTGERYTTAKDAVTSSTAAMRTPVELVPDLIKRGLAAGASDIHLDPDPDGLVIRFRVGGRLRESGRLDPAAGRGLVETLRKVSTDGSAPEGEATGRLELAIDGKPVALRVSFMPTVDGDRAAIRVVDATWLSPLAGLGYSDTDRSKLQRACHVTGIVAFEHEGVGFPEVVQLLIPAMADGSRSFFVIGPDPQLGGAALSRVRTGDGMTTLEAMRLAYRSDPDGFVIDRIHTAEEFALAAELGDTGHHVLIVVAPGALASAGLKGTVVTATSVTPV